MNVPNIKQTNWNLKLLFKNDNDPNLLKTRKQVEKKSYKFIDKWHNRTDYLTNPKALKQSLYQPLHYQYRR